MFAASAVRGQAANIRPGHKKSAEPSAADFFEETVLFLLYDKKALKNTLTRVLFTRIPASVCRRHQRL
jgi:hypothetical protein